MSAILQVAAGWCLLGAVVGYAAGRWRPWGRLGDWLEDQCDRCEHGPWWRQVPLVPLMWIRFPKSLPYTIKWWCGWRPPPPPPRRRIELSEIFGGPKGGAA